MTKIEWVRGSDGSEGLSWNCMRAIVLATGKSANHCEHVNEACRFCYAERQNPRAGGFDFKRQYRDRYRFEIDERKLVVPLLRRKPTRIFVESMSDTFGEWWSDEQIACVYAIMAATPRHTYINLSKRPERRRKWLSDPKTRHEVEIRKPGHTGPITEWPLPNVIEGTSASCQEEADDFCFELAHTPAAIRALSAEPLLGPIHLRGAWRLDWVICGGESGPHARPMHPAWARSLRDQCREQGIPFFFKQWGEWVPPMDAPFAAPDEAPSSSMICMDLEPGRERVLRLGKKAAGRLLDNVEHNDFPRVATEPLAA